MQLIIELQVITRILFQGQENNQKGKLASYGSLSMAYIDLYAASIMLFWGNSGQDVFLRNGGECF